MASRTDPNLTDKLCALILLYFGIPHEVGKNLTREQIMGMVQWDHHPVPVAIAKDLGWEPAVYNHPSNLAPLLREDHAVKTAKQDVPRIAKAQRVMRKHAAFRSLILSKSGQGADAAPDDVSRETVRHRPSRWPQGQKIPSRPFRKKAP